MTASEQYVFAGCYCLYSFTMIFIIFAENTAEAEIQNSKFRIQNSKNKEQRTKNKFTMHNAQLSFKLHFLQINN